MERQEFVIKLIKKIDKDDFNITGYSLKQKDFGWIPCEIVLILKIVT